MIQIQFILLIKISNKVKIVKMNENSCTLEITSGKSGKFKLSYFVGEEEISSIEIIIESL